MLKPNSFVSDDQAIEQQLRRKEVDYTRQVAKLTQEASREHRKTTGKCDVFICHVK